MKSARKMRPTRWNIAKDNSAASFIEFAIALPVLLTLFIGGLDLARYFHTYHKVNRAVDEIGEFITASSQISELDLQVYTEAVMGNFGAGISSRSWNLGNDLLVTNRQRAVAVTSLYKYSNNRTRVMWRRSVCVQPGGNFQATTSSTCPTYSVGQGGNDGIPNGGVFGDKPNPDLFTSLTGVFTSNPGDLTNNQLNNRLNRNSGVPFALLEGQTLIVVEAQVRYRPMFLQVFGTLAPSHVYRRSLFVPRRGPLTCIQPGVLGQIFQAITAGVLSVNVPDCCARHLDICADGLGV